MKKFICSIIFAIGFLSLPSSGICQFSILPEKSNLTFTIDHTKKNNLQIVFLYEGVKGVETDIEGTLDFGIIDSKKLKFESTKWKVSNSQRIVVSLTIDTAFKYKDFVQKICFLKMTSKSQTIPITQSESKVQISFLKKTQEEPPIPSIFRLNIGTNLDYLQTNPFKLLYLDANIMSANAFKTKFFKNQRDFGIYARVYQFQGISQINQTKPIKFSDSIGVSGTPKIIKYLNSDSLLIAQPKYSQKFSDNLNIRSYGMAFGITYPFISDFKNNFHLSFGIHFEGILSLYESEIINTEILNDTLKVSQTNYLKNYNNILLDKRRGTNFTNTIGVSMPIIWRFSAFELKILPATTLFKTRLGSIGYLNSANRLPSYSIHASLSEIKQTGLSIGGEIRGFYSIPPTTFSIFIAKMFNLEKLGEILKI